MDIKETNWTNIATAGKPENQKTWTRPKDASPRATNSWDVEKGLQKPPAEPITLPASQDQEPQGQQLDTFEIDRGDEIDNLALAADGLIKVEDLLPANQKKSMAAGFDSFKDPVAIRKKYLAAMLLQKETGLKIPTIMASFAATAKMATGTAEPADVITRLHPLKSFNATEPEGQPRKSIKEAASHGFSQAGLGMVRSAAGAIKAAAEQARADGDIGRYKELNLQEYLVEIGVKDEDEIFDLSKSLLELSNITLEAIQLYQDEHQEEQMNFDEDRSKLMQYLTRPELIVQSLAENAPIVLTGALATMGGNYLGNWRMMFGAAAKSTAAGTAAGWAAMSSSVFGEYYLTNREAGMDPDEALIASSFTAAIEGGIEQWNLGWNISLFKKAATGEIKKGFAKAAGKVVLTGLKAAGRGGLEEGSQEINQNFWRMLYNNEQLHAAGLLEGSWDAAQSGMVMEVAMGGGFSAAGKIKAAPGKIAKHNTLKRIEQYRSDINNTEDISEEDKTKLNKSLDNAAAMINENKFDHIYTKRQKEDIETKQRLTESLSKQFNAPPEIIAGFIDNVIAAQAYNQGMSLTQWADKHLAAVLKETPDGTFTAEYGNFNEAQAASEDILNQMQADGLDGRVDVLGTTLTFTPTDGDQLFQATATTEPAQAKAAEIIEQKMTGPMQPAEFKSMLKNAGVRGSEIEWIFEGIEEDSNITQAQAKDLIAANNIKIKETTLTAEHTQYSEYQLDSGMNYREMVFSFEEGKEGTRHEAQGRGETAFSPAGYQSPHWKDQAGVFAHARLNDRIDADGARVLFIEEMQSDMAKTDLADGPVVKNWHKNVIKRLTRYAAENGYDKIAWTTATQQVKRWANPAAEIANRVVAIKDGIDSYTLLYAKDSQQLGSEQRGVSIEAITKQIGRQAAEQIQSNKSGYVELTDIEIPIGPAVKGFQDLYDNKLLQAANAIGKHAGVNVTTAELPTSGGKTEQVHTLDLETINDDMTAGSWMYQTEEGTREIADLSSSFNARVTQKEVREYINILIEEGLKIATLSPDWLVDIQASRRSKRKILNEGNYKELDKSHQKRHKNMLLNLEKILSVAKYTGFSKNKKVDKKPNIEKYHYFESYVRIGKKTYKIIFDTEQYNGASEKKPQTVHLYNVTEISQTGDYAKRRSSRKALDWETSKNILSQNAEEVKQDFESAETAGNVNYKETPAKDVPKTKGATYRGVKDDGSWMYQEENGTRHEAQGNSDESKAETLKRFENIKPVEISITDELHDYSKRVKDLLQWIIKNSDNKIIGTHKNDKIGNIIVSKKLINRILSHGSGIQKVQLLLSLDKLLNNAELVKSQTNPVNTELTDHILATKAKIDGEDFVVGILLREDHNGIRIHTVELRNAKKLYGNTSGLAIIMRPKAENHKASIMSIVKDSLNVKQNPTQNVLFQDQPAGYSEGYRKRLTGQLNSKIATHPLYVEYNQAAAGRAEQILSIVGKMNFGALTKDAQEAAAGGANSHQLKQYIYNDKAKTKQSNAKKPAAWDTTAVELAETIGYEISDPYELLELIDNSITAADKSGARLNLDTIEKLKETEQPDINMLITSLEMIGRGDSIEAVNEMVDEFGQAYGFDEAARTEMKLQTEAQAAAAKAKQQRAAKRNVRKAAVSFGSDGKALLMAFEAADFSSLVHEMGHIFRRSLSKQQTKIVEDWAGVTGGVWTRQSEELFARAFEKYVYDGKAPETRMQKPFEAFAAWLKKIYISLEGSPIDVEIAEPVRRVFDRMIGSYEIHPGQMTYKQYMGRVTREIGGNESPWLNRYGMMAGQTWHSKWKQLRAEYKASDLVDKAAGGGGDDTADLSVDQQLQIKAIEAEAIRPTGVKAATNRVEKIKQAFDKTKLAGSTLTEVIEAEQLDNYITGTLKRELAEAYRSGQQAGINKAQKNYKQAMTSMAAKRKLRILANWLAKKIMTKVPKTVAVEYQQMIAEIQEQLDPKFRRKSTLENREKIKELAERGIKLPKKIVALANKKAINQFTMAELQQMADQIKELTKQGRKKQQLRFEQHAREVDGKRDMIISKLMLRNRKTRKGGKAKFNDNDVKLIAAGNDGPDRLFHASYKGTLLTTAGLGSEPKTFLAPAGNEAAETQIKETILKQLTADIEMPITGRVNAWDLTTRTYQSFIASALRPSRIADLLDGGDARFDGPTHEFFINAVNEAYEKENRISDQRIKTGTDALERFEIDIKELDEIRVVGGQKFTVQELAGIYGFAQNEKSWLAVIWGNLHGSERLMADIVHHCETEDPRLKQLAWFLINEFEANYDRLDQAFVDAENRTLIKEENYLPLSRREMDYSPDKRGLMEEMIERSNLKKAYTKKGFTISRQDIPKEFQKSVQIDLWNLWTSHVKKQEHYINSGRLVGDLQKIINDSELRRVANGRLGNEYLENLASYVNRVANPNIYRAFTNLSRVSAWLRSNAAIAYLGFNPNTMIKQLPSLFYFASESGMKHLVASLYSFATNPKAMIELVTSRDIQVGKAEMERVMMEISQQKTAFDNKILSAIATGHKKVATASTQGIQWMDLVARVIGWNAVYQKALADGKSEQEAINAARNATLRTQPAGAAKDIADMYTDHGKFGITPWMLMFTNQTNQIFNMLSYDIPRRVRDGNTAAGILAAGSVALGGILMWTISNKRPPRDKEEYGQAFLDQTIVSLPMVGGAIMQAKSGFSGDSGPFADLANIVTDPLDFKNSLASAGVLAGVPANQIKRTINAVNEDDPSLIFGRGGKKKKKKTKKINLGR